VSRTQKTTILCDSCNKDISPAISGYEAEYILQIKAINVAMHKSGQAIYSMMCHPPIDDDLYFCGLKCMTDYKANKNG
jgi:hypothetical protein